MNKSDVVRPKSGAVALVAASVSSVAHKRQAAGGKLHPYLMRSSGIELDFDKGESLFPVLQRANALIVKRCLSYALVHFLYRIGFVLRGVVKKKVVKNTFFFGQGAVYNGDIFF